MAEVQSEERWRADAEARLASLAKPPGALGTLEDWCVTLCVAQKTLRPTVSAVALVFCGDHGCKKADAALSPYPASATQAIFRTLAAGTSCAAVLDDLVTGAATRLRVAPRQQGQEARRRDVVPDADLADADNVRSARRGRGDAISSHEQGRVEARTVAVTLVLVSMRVRVVIAVITRIVHVAGHRRRREGGRPACDFDVDHLDSVGRRSVGHVAVNANVHDH